MNITNSGHDALMKILHQGINKQIETIIEEEAKAAALRTEERVKKMIAQVAANVCLKLSLEPYGPNQLRITLDFNDKPRTLATL